MLRTPQTQYERLVQAGSLRGDEHQREVVGQLQDLHDQLASYDRSSALTDRQGSSLVCRAVCWIKMCSDYARSCRDCSQ